VQLIIQCFEQAKLSDSDSQATGFWDHIYSLTKSLADRTALLQAQLTATSVKEDPVAFSVHMNICAIDIYLNEAAISQIHRQGLPAMMSKDHQKRSTSAALKISSALRLNWPADKSEDALFFIQSTFLNWAITIAMKPLCRELTSLSPREAASSGIGHSLKLLLTALDYSEEPDGFWHNSTANIAATMQEWEERSSFDAVGS
jgi:hypothetical protein